MGPEQAINLAMAKGNYKRMPDFGRVMEIMVPAIPSIKCIRDLHDRCPLMEFSSIPDRACAEQVIKALMSHRNLQLSYQHHKLALMEVLKNDNPRLFCCLLGVSPGIDCDEDKAKKGANINKKLGAMGFGRIGMNMLVSERKLETAEWLISHKVAHTNVNIQGFWGLCKDRQTDLIMFVMKHQLLDMRTDPWSIAYLDDANLINELLCFGLEPNSIALIRAAGEPHKTCMIENAHRRIESLASAQWGEPWRDPDEATERCLSLLIRCCSNLDQEFEMPLAAAAACGCLNSIKLILNARPDVDRSGAINAALLRGDYKLCHVLARDIYTSYPLEPLGVSWRVAWPHPSADVTKFLDEMKSLGIYSDEMYQKSFASMLASGCCFEQLLLFLQGSPAKIDKAAFIAALKEGNESIQHVMALEDYWSLEEPDKEAIIEHILNSIKWIYKCPLLETLSKLLKIGFQCNLNGVLCATFQICFCRDEVNERRLYEAVNSCGANPETKADFLRNAVLPRFPFWDEPHAIKVFHMLHGSGFPFDFSHLNEIQTTCPFFAELIQIMEECLMD